MHRFILQINPVAGLSSGDETYCILPRNGRTFPVSLSLKIVPARIRKIRHIVNLKGRMTYAEKEIYRTSDNKGIKAG